jgi:cardiolipin synthase
MARSLIVLPDDSAQPILAAIDGAARTLRVKMFVFSDPSLLKAVVGAKRRGVKVRVMLNPARRHGEHDNDTTRAALERADIDVKDANPAFALTHEKSMVIDDETAFVKSLNWATRNLTETRDYAVVTRRAHDVAEVIECFEADWHRHAFAPREKSHLVWCPGFGRDRLCQFIDEARHRLFVQNERFQDTVIIERLVGRRDAG